MPPINFTEVLSYSSEDKSYPADNLLSAHAFRKWKIAASEVGKQASVTLRLEKLSLVRSVDIGNNGSAFVEVLVARDDGDDFQVLLAASSFMSPMESRQQTPLCRVRMFGPDKLNGAVVTQKWSRVKFVATQPFNKTVPFGLAFVTLNSPDVAPVPSSDMCYTSLKVNKLGSMLKLTEEEEDKDSDRLVVGAMFARHKQQTAAAAAQRTTPLTGGGGNTTSPVSTTKRNADHLGFYQLKKKKAPTTTISESEDLGSKTPNSPQLNKPASSGDSKTPTTSTSNNRLPRQQPPRRPANDSTTQNTTKNKKDIKKTPNIQTVTNMPTHSNDSGKNENKRDSAKYITDKNNGTNNTTHTDNNTNNSANSSNTSDRKHKTQYTGFPKLMGGVVFVLSGYQNPQRGQLRGKMLSMGAKYKPDWDHTCTHLICAFMSTPKYQAVRGRGKVVTHRWVDDCHIFKKKFPWKRYRLDKDESSSESEGEVWAEELRPPPVKPAAQQLELPSMAITTTAAATAVTTAKRIPVSSPSPATASFSDVAEMTKSPVSDEEGVVDEYGADTDHEEDTDDEIERALHAGGKQPATAEPTEAGTAADGPTSGGIAVMGGRHDHRVSSSDDSYEDNTDVDEPPPVVTHNGGEEKQDTSSLPLPPLPDCFANKVFFLYGHLTAAASLRRYIIAFAGTVSERMSRAVQFIITEEQWSDGFDEAARVCGAGVKFVRPEWVWRCSEATNGGVDCRDYLVHPSPA